MPSELFLNKELATQNRAGGEILHAASQHQGHGQSTLVSYYFLRISQRYHAAVLAWSRSDAKQQLSVGRLGLLPVFSPDDSLQAFSRCRFSCDRFGIATKAIILGVFRQACAHTVKIDVRGSRIHGLFLGLDQHAREPFCPQRAVSTVALVKPNRKPLPHQFHVGRKSAHHVHWLTPPLLSFTSPSSQLFFDHLQSRGLVFGRLRIQ